MKYTMIEMIEKAFEDESVCLCVEAMVRTPRETEARDIAVIAFTFTYERAMKAMLEEDIGYGGESGIVYRIQPTEEGRRELMKTTGFPDRLKRIVRAHRLYNYEIGTETETYIHLKDRRGEVYGPYIKVCAHYTGNEQVDNRINEIIMSIGK